MFVIFLKQLLLKKSNLMFQTSMKLGIQYTVTKDLLKRSVNLLSVKTRSPSMRFGTFVTKIDDDFDADYVIFNSFIEREGRSVFNSVNRSK